MKSKTFHIGAALLVAALPLAACSKADDGAATDAKAAGTTASTSGTLASALSGADGFGTLEDAIENAGLATLFDGPASYTILAPNDAAFKALGDKGTELMGADQRALLVAVLRNHLVPGHLTAEAITKAIDTKGGPVTMTTLGDSKVTFAKEGDAITVTNDEGGTAKISGEAIAASNGVIIPLDTVLLPKETAAE